MDDRTLKELIYLARSNDPVALQYLYSYYDALVKAVMRKMKYISSMSLEPQDLLQVGLITFDKVFWSYRDDLDTTFDVYAKSCIIKKMQTSVYKGYKQDKIEMRGDRAEMSDFPLYLNTVAGGLDCRDQTIGSFSFVVKIYAVPVIEIIG